MSNEVQDFVNEWILENVREGEFLIKSDDETKELATKLEAAAKEKGYSRETLVEAIGELEVSISDARELANTWESKPIKSEQR